METSIGISCSGHTKMPAKPMGQGHKLFRYSVYSVSAWRILGVAIESCGQSTRMQYDLA